MVPSFVALSAWLRATLVSIPAWALVPALFLFFFAVSLSARALVRGRADGERRDEIAEEATRSLTGIAASFAFFVGFAITMSWGAVSAGQSAIEEQATRAQQLVWIIGNVSDDRASAAMLSELRTYLVTASERDQPALERGDVRDLPSSPSLDSLQEAIHAYAFGPGTSDPEAASLAEAAANLGASVASVAAVAQRSLPPLMGILLLVVATLLATVSGMSSARAHRPLLLPVWCLLPALAISVIPGPGGIGIDLSPLLLVADRIAG